jgi:hypothetical protein
LTSTSASASVKEHPLYALGLAEADGLTLADGDWLAEGLTEREAEAEGETEALRDAEGLTEALGLTEGLTVVMVGDCQLPSASTTWKLPAGSSAIEPLPYAEGVPLANRESRTSCAVVPKATIFPPAS